MCATAKAAIASIKITMAQLTGFAKSDQENISDDELNTLRMRGRAFLELKPKQLVVLAAGGELLEVSYGDAE